MRGYVDVNEVVDQQSLDEDRDNRRYGNTEFEYIGNNIEDTEEE